MLEFTIDDAGQIVIRATSLPAWCTGIVVELPNNQNFTYAHNGRPPAPDLDLTQLIAQFLDHLEVIEDRRPNTISGYRKRLAQFSRWCGQANRCPARPDTWTAYYARLKRRGLSAYTIKGHYHILNRFARWLVERGCLPDHPLEQVQPPEPPKNDTPKAILKSHIEEMLAAAETPRERAVLLFFRDTGCRAAEALALTWADIDFDEGKARALGKGNKRRDLFFRPPTRQALNAYRQSLAQAGPNDPVWQGKKGRLSYDGLYKLFKSLAARADLSEDVFSPHAWRHAFGRDTTLAGIPTAQLQDLLGHSDIGTTKVYARFDTTELQQAHARYSPVNDSPLPLGEGLGVRANDNLTPNGDGVK